MRAVIEKGRARGKISAPPSKSMAHRLLIGAALAEGVSRVRGISLCEDVLATVDCLNALGAKIELSGGEAVVSGFDPRLSKPTAPLSARESGSTLRFLLPLALLSGNPARFVGAGRLMERPMEVYRQLCNEHGLLFRQEDGITVAGALRGCDISLRGDVSSQFITGLLFALPFLGGERRIHITTDIESRSYIDLTLAAMGAFGVMAVWENERTLLVPEGSRYTPRDVTVEGDWSGAAFPEALNLFGGEVEISGLLSDSSQGDRVYRRYYEALLSGRAELSIKDCPDLGPVLFAVASALNGARITDTRRLRIKESDRAAAMAEELSKFGGRVRVYENSVEIDKTELHAPKEILCGHNDHRIVMALSVLCTLFGGEIEGASAVSKSYPTFFDDLGKLGIKVRLYETE